MRFWLVSSLSNVIHFLLCSSPLIFSCRLFFFLFKLLVGIVKQFDFILMAFLDHPVDWLKHILLVILIIEEPSLFDCLNLVCFLFLNFSLLVTSEPCEHLSPFL
jgi:hypothetical protein